MSSPSRAGAAASSVARTGEHEGAVKDCMTRAAEAGLKSFVMVGLGTTAAVVAATYASPWFARRLGPSGKTALAFSPALFWGFASSEQEMTSCTRSRRWAN